MSRVALMMAGGDDHGVKDATLYVRLGSETPSSKNMLENQEPRPEFKVTETLDLAKMRVKPGDVISYRLTVRDNKDPIPNKAETAYQVIEVTEPASPEQKQQLEEKQRKETEPVDQSPPLEAGRCRPERYHSESSGPERRGEARLITPESGEE